MTPHETIAAIEAATAELRHFIETCPDSSWTSTVEGDGWTVAVAAHHMAVGHGLVIDWVSLARRGAPILGTREAQDEENAEQAVEFGDVTRETTLALLDANAAALATLITGLSDEEWNREARFGPAQRDLSAGQLAGLAAEHIRGHLGRVRASAI